MKNLIKYILVGVVFTGMIACDNLEPIDENRLDFDFVNSNPAAAEGILLNAYTGLVNQYSFSEAATDDAQANVSDDDISIDEIPAFNSSTNNTNDLLKKRMEEVENGTDNKSPSIIDEEESNDVNDVFTNSIRLHAAFGAATGLNLPFMALGGASGLAALQEIASRPGSADNSRKNKRKNFRPRNIVYDNTENGEDGGDIDIDDDKEEGDEERKNSPMDLSVSNRPPDFDSSSEGGCDSPNPGVSPGPGTSPGQSRSGSPGIMASSPIPSQSPNQPSKPIGK